MAVLEAFELWYQDVGSGLDYMHASRRQAMETAYIAGGLNMLDAVAESAKVRFGKPEREADGTPT